MPSLQACPCGHQWAAAVSTSACPSCGALLSGTLATDVQALAANTPPPLPPDTGTMLTANRVPTGFAQKPLSRSGVPTPERAAPRLRARHVSYTTPYTTPIHHLVAL